MYLSEGIQLLDKNYHVAYSNKDEFYLIALSHDGLECSKIVDVGSKNSSYNPLNWFKKSEVKHHYDSVYFKLIKREGYSTIKMIAILDTTVFVYEINP